jgi:hypothetical protein
VLVCENMAVFLSGQHGAITVDRRSTPPLLRYYSCTAVTNSTVADGERSDAMSDAHARFLVLVARAGAPRPDEPPNRERLIEAT